MKITKIHLKNWHQFQDLELDFTYPKGHEKEGQPLKKVCFIGPNSVGKTKLLNLIANLGKHNFGYSDYFKNFEINVDYLIDNDEIVFIKNIAKTENYNNDIRFNYHVNVVESLGYDDGFSKLSTKYDPSEIFNGNLSDVSEANRSKIDLTNLKSKIIFADQLADFKGEVTSLGTSVNVDIPQYVIQTSKIKIDSKVGELGYGMIVDRKIANIATSENGKIVEMLEKNPEKTRDEIFSQFGEFKRIKEIFSEVTDNLISLDKYDADTTDLVFKTKNGEEVNRFDLSSGVEQIFYRLLFVASFNLKESIILVDEPEISLFPDKQKKIVGWYTDYCDLGNSNQFFFATHSPLVAGQFEACEIFKLDFDEGGKVKRISVDSEPRFLDLEGASDLLYDIDKNIPLTQEGESKLERLKFLTRNIKSAKEENDQDKIKKLFPEYEKLVQEIGADYYYPEFTL